MIWWNQLQDQNNRCSFFKILDINKLETDTKYYTSSSISLASFLFSIGSAVSFLRYKSGMWSFQNLNGIARSGATAHLVEVRYFLIKHIQSRAGSLRTNIWEVLDLNINKGYWSLGLFCGPRRWRSFQGLVKRRDSGRYKNGTLQAYLILVALFFSIPPSFLCAFCCKSPDMPAYRTTTYESTAINLVGYSENLLQVLYALISMLRSNCRSSSFIVALLRSVRAGCYAPTIPYA